MRPREEQRKEMVCVGEKASTEIRNVFANIGLITLVQTILFHFRFQFKVVEHTSCVSFQRFSAQLKSGNTFSEKEVWGV